MSKIDAVAEHYTHGSLLSSIADGVPRPASTRRLHILMGHTAPDKVRSMIENVSRNRIAPVELIAERRG